MFHPRGHEEILPNVVILAGVKAPSLQILLAPPEEKGSVETCCEGIFFLGEGVRRSMRPPAEVRRLRVGEGGTNPGDGGANAEAEEPNAGRGPNVE